MDIVKGIVQVTPLSYHLCPICGLPSETSSFICSRHYSLTYSSSGELLAVNGELVEV